MTIKSTPPKFRTDKKTCLAIGTFDGVHLGHQKVFKHLLEFANSNDLIPTVLTFSEHPKLVLKKNIHIKLLNTLEERVQLIKQQGIENVVVHEFNRDFSNLTTAAFVREILVNKLKIGLLCMGYNHRLGKDRTGDFTQLQKLGNLYDFSVQQIPKEELKDFAISSTKIRDLIIKGEIENANSFLGYSYKLLGVVVKGDSLGRKIGYPTANLQIKDQHKLIPKNGVYLVESMVNGKLLQGLMNIGIKPTFGSHQQTLEVHFLNFTGDLYGQKIGVSLLKYIRVEHKFDSPEQLKLQIQKDEKVARSFFCEKKKTELIS